jgi:predicted  nucleic acid-binding Zn-ribbon protein
MNLAFKLYRLQQIDSQLGKGSGRLRQIEEILADDNDLKQASREVEFAESGLAKTRAELAKAERDTGAQKEKISETEQKLYSGRITNPKDLQDLEREVDALRRRLDVLEDRQLEAMFTTENAQEMLNTAHAQVDAVSARSVERNASLLGEQSVLLAEVTRLEEERIAAISSIDPQDLSRYDHLRLQKKGVAVTRVVDKTCGACGATLSATLLQAAHSPNDLAYCTTCGRILYSG